MRPGNKSRSVGRDSFRKEQLLPPLLLVERRLHPEVCCAQQNAFCEGRNTLDIEFFDRLGVMINLGDRQLLAQLIALTAKAGKELTSCELWGAVTGPPPWG